MVNQTIRLGRVFGLEIRFNWSLILIYLLIAWTMATTVLPQAAPNQAAWAYWVSGLLGALVFYGCLLAHEISHALVARRKGVRVAGITLWLFGGVTQLDGQPATAAAEALITVVGPLTSLAIAAIGFGVAVGLTAAGASALITNLISWLAILNLVLGVFNLVPAFPLDGGRLLSSLIWWHTGSRQKGTHGAVRVGRVFASLVIAGGLLEIVLGGLLSGIWLGFIGWFLFSAGGAEERQTQIRAALKTVSVATAMTAPVVTVPDWLTVEQLLGAGGGQHRTPIFVLHDPSGEWSGLVHLGDLLALTSPARRQQRLREFALPITAFPTADVHEDLEAVLRRVGPALERGVLVMDGSELVGVISGMDVARMAGVP
ncbi:MAG: site-2 protease family protein [Candidatus Dormibacteria bacterium]